MNTNTENKAEAERLLGIAEKLLTNRDLNGSKEFAILAQATEPLLEGSNQILAKALVFNKELSIYWSLHSWPLQTAKLQQ